MMFTRLQWYQQIETEEEGGFLVHNLKGGVNMIH